MTDNERFDWHLDTLIAQVTEQLRDCQRALEIVKTLPQPKAEPCRKLTDNERSLLADAPIAFWTFVDEHQCNLNEVLNYRRSGNWQVKPEPCFDCGWDAVAVQASSCEPETGYVDSMALCHSCYEARVAARSPYPVSDYDPDGRA